MILFLVVLLSGPLWGWAASQEAFETVRYRLDVTYDVATHTLDGNVTVRAVWRGTQPLTALYFFLPPNTLQRRDPREPAAFSDLRYARGFDAARLTVHHVTDGDQKALPFQLQDDDTVPVGHVPDDALLHVSLPQAYGAGESFALHIAFTTRVPEAKNWGVYRGIVALAGHWYPLLVPYRQGQWVWGMQAFVHAHYTLHITTDAAQQVVASIPWSRRTQQNGRQMLMGQGGPLYHLGLSSGATWGREADGDHQPALHVMALPADHPFAADILQTLRSVLAFYRQAFGLELSNALTVVIHERDQSWPFSASADNLLLLSRDVARVPSLVRKLREYFVARGLAQQWWGLRTAYNLNTERWIGEGLATYMAFRWLDHAYGSGRNFLTWKGAWLPNFSYREQNLDLRYRRLAVMNRDPRMNTPLDQTKDRPSLRFVYEKKGALVYRMLHDLLGAAAFQDFLRVLSTEDGQALVTGDDVRRAAEAVSSRDLTWFFRQWVEQRVTLDYAVGEVNVTPQTDAQGRTVYRSQVEIQRLGEAVMPVTVRLVARDGQIYDAHLAGQARVDVVRWQHTAPLSDIIIDPEADLPDVYRLNNTERLPYTVRPLIDFPRQDRYLLYPFITLDNNYIDGNILQVHFVARYLDDQLAAVSVGYKEETEDISVEARVERRRFPHRDMASGVSFTDRFSARTLTLETSLTLRESHQQWRLPVNRIGLGYRISFLDRVDEFHGEPVPDDFAPSTGRLNSVVMRYQRDTRIPLTRGAPVRVIAEPLAYGYVLRLQLELNSELLGSDRPDFQQVRWEASEFLRLWNQTWLQLRLFGGWSAGTIPFQRKLTLAGIDTVRGYPYRLRFLGDRMLGGTVGLRLPVWRDVRLEDPGRYVGLRSLHIAPFVDGGWVWDRGEEIADTRLRSSAGLRLIAGIGFGSLLRFEVAIDIAYPLDEQGRDEDEGVQIWLRFQSTARGGVH